MSPKRRKPKNTGTTRRPGGWFLPRFLETWRAETPEQAVRRIDIAMLVLLVFCAAVVPLIVYLKVVPLAGTHQAAWSGSDEHMDFFSWWKAAALITSMSGLLLLHLLRRMKSQEKLEMPRLFLPLLLYLMFAFLSSVSSAVPEIAFGGFADRAEGLWVLLAYGVLAYTAFVLSRRAKWVRVILIGVFAGAAVMALIGILQFLGMDLFQTDFGKRLMLPKAFEQFLRFITFNFGANIMYTTVYNPNYLGSYASLLLPVAGAMTLVWARERSAAYFGGLLAVLALFVLWLGSMSRAGLLGGAVAVALFVLLQPKTLVRQWLPVLGILVVMGGAFFAMNGASNGKVAEEFLRTLPNSLQVALGREPVDESMTGSGVVAGLFPGQEPEPGMEDPLEDQPVYVKEVRLKDNRFRFETSTEALELVMDKTPDALSFICYDTKGSPLQLDGTDGQDGTLTFLDPRYAEYGLLVNGNQVRVNWGSYRFLLANENGVMTYEPKPSVTWTEVTPAPAIGFTGREKFASGRGWIWSRTFPLLGNTLFTGYGPDTYAVYFPQQDIAGKINVFRSANIVVDKPHNWYLQVAVNTGLISLLGILWLLVSFGFDALRARFGLRVHGMAPLFTGEIHVSDAGEASQVPAAQADGKAGILRNRNAFSRNNLLLTGLLCGVVGYAVAGLFNDSVVSVAPVFWVILGLGAGLLRDAERRVPKPQISTQPGQAASQP